MNSDSIRQEFAGVNWSRLFAGERSIWEAFKNEIVRVQGLHVPISGKVKAGRNREPWMKSARGSGQKKSTRQSSCVGS